MPPELLGPALGRPQQAAEVLRGYAGRLVLATDGGLKVGVLGYRLDGGRAEILHVAVDPDHRGRGIGRALLAWLGAQAAEVEAETDAAAVGFYRACGFAVAPAASRHGEQRFAVSRSRP